MSIVYSSAWALRFPPVIRWSYDGDDDEYTVAKMNKEERQGLRWRYTSTTGNLVKNMLKRIGFKPSSTKYVRLLILTEPSALIVDDCRCLGMVGLGSGVAT